MISNPSPKRNVYPVGKRRLKFRYFLVLLVGLAVLGVSRPYSPPEAQTEEPGTQEAPLLTVLPESVDQPEKLPVTVEEKIVRRGDTLYDILKAKGVDDSRIIAVSDKKIEGINPSRLVAGRS